MSDFDSLSDGLMDECLGVFGDEVTFSPKAGGTHSIKGIFDEDAELQLSNPPIPTVRPTLEVKLADLPVVPVQDDEFTIRGKTYFMDWMEPAGPAHLIILRK